MYHLPNASRLGTKIFLTFTLALALLSFIFGFFTTHFGGQLLMKSAGNELRVLSVVLSDLIQNQFSNLESNLEDVVEDEVLTSQLADKVVSKTWLESYLKLALEHNSHLTDLIIYDMDARCVGATDSDWYRIQGKSWSFFRQGVGGFNFPPIYGTEGEGRVQLVSAPIFKDQVVVGVIVAVVDLTDIYGLMEQKIGLSDTTDAFLLDGDLRFITAGRSKVRGLVDSHLASTTLAGHLKDEYWVGEYRRADGVQVLGTALKIPGYSWYVVIERNFDDVFQQISSLRNAVIAVSLGLLSIFILASFALSRSITRPLLQLVQSTRRIAAGQYSEPVVVSQEIEEVVFIGAELERMRRRIASSQGRLQDQLSKSEQLRIEGERLATIGTLAASLAHEIRNPLNAMSLLLSRLKYTQNLDTRKHLTEDLFSEVGRLDRLVSSILDYARPVQIQRKTLDIRALLLSVLDLYYELAGSLGVSLSVIGGDPLSIHADPDQLKQCLVNLVKNALDSSSAGGKISMSASILHSELVMEISDTGIGIPLELQAKLFNPFFTTKENGVGLGLSSVHKIIAAHGGRIVVKSDPQKALEGVGPKGSTFSIQFPII
jgi:signal transduction histidine kinase